MICAIPNVSEYEDLTDLGDLEFVDEVVCPRCKRCLFIVKCPRCRGNGWHYSNGSSIKTSFFDKKVPCAFCKTKGRMVLSRRASA